MSSEEKPESFASLLAEVVPSDERRASTRVGAKIDVVVTQIGKSDVFVSLGAKQEGFIERALLTDKEGKLSVEIGSRVTARVVEHAGRTGAVRLEPLVVRAPHDDTAQAAPQIEGPVLEEGLKVKGKVVRVERYGVFVQIHCTQGRKGRGLVPTAETGTPRGADLNKAFPLDAEVEAKILKIEEDGKIRLSISALKVDEERSQFEAFAKDARSQNNPRPSNPKEPPPKKLGTLGLLLQQKLAKKLGPPALFRPIRGSPGASGAIMPGHGTPPSQVSPAPPAPRPPLAPRLRQRRRRIDHQQPPGRPGRLLRGLRRQGRKLRTERRRGQQRRAGRRLR